MASKTRPANGGRPWLPSHLFSFDLDFFSGHFVDDGDGFHPRLPLGLHGRDGRCLVDPQCHCYLFTQAYNATC
jgi:hypothetical protein